MTNRSTSEPKEDDTLRFDFLHDHPCHLQQQVVGDGSRSCQASLFLAGLVRGSHPWRSRPEHDTGVPIHTEADLIYLLACLSPGTQMAILAK
jgi:hypothetical protein